MQAAVVAHLVFSAQEAEKAQSKLPSYTSQMDKLQVLWETLPK